MARNWLRRTRAALALGLVALTGAAAAQEATPADHPSLLLMGTIPIYWGEAGELTDLLNGAANPHWARAVLERHYALVPIDTLSAETLPAAGGVLLMAQPRTLSAPENVALDAWVRGGGRVLLFADPLMTGESRFSIGDRRRPQDVALLSPLLTHWGLDLRLADGQQPGLRFVAGEGGMLPVNLAGTIAAGDGSGCAVSHQDTVATCHLGAGLAVVVADAALLDIEGPWPGAAESLESLLSTVSQQNGDAVHSRSGLQEESHDFSHLDIPAPGAHNRDGGPAPPP